MLSLATGIPVTNAHNQLKIFKLKRQEVTEVRFHFLNFLKAHL
jgi:hypothetical protein